MALRTTSTRATLQGEATKRLELGIDTVVVSSYGMCSKTCEPWQGKVYIDDVFCDFKGEISGERGKSSYCEKWFTLLSVAVKNGLFHPNCRHTLSTYIDGVTSIPKPIDGQVIKKQRELEQRQRAMERKIRRLKRLVAGTFDESRLKAYKSQLRLAQRELKEFVCDHSDILRRDYSSEREYDTVDKSEKSVIIKEKTTSDNRFVTSQERIDEVLKGDLKGIDFSAKPVYNARIRCNGRTIIAEDNDRNVIYIERIEIGKQDKSSVEFLEDTIIHEELEARIAMRSIHSTKYKILYNSNDVIRHEYINGRIKRYFKLKGWWYDND